MTATRVLDLPALAAVVRDVGLDRLLDELIERTTEALAHHDPEEIETIDRRGFHYAKPDFGLVEWMPAMATGRRVSIKTVAYHPSNPVERGCPSILASTALYDTTDGRLVALCEATFLTALRTGAASAVATEVLAAPSSSVVGIVGCGAQAVAQLHALSRVRPIERVLAYDADASVARTLACRLPPSVEVEIEVIDADALPRLLGESDIVVTATSNRVDAPPVLPDGPIRPWLHVNAVGSDFPGKVELDAALLRRATVCPDVIAQCLVEGEAQQLTVGELGPDLPSLVADRARHGGLQTEFTVFDSTGWALEDLIAAELFNDHAQRLGVGAELDLQPAPRDPYDPYEGVRG